MAKQKPEVLDEFEQRMKPLKDKISELLKQQRELMISEDKREITKTTYDTKAGPLEKERRELTSQIINIMKERDTQRELQMEKRIQAEKQHDEQVKQLKREARNMSKEETPKLGRKTNENSYASVIAKALQMKSINNIEKATAKVCALKPGREEDKVKAQIKTIIRIVKNGTQARWKAYTWDEEKYLLIPKE